MQAASGLALALVSAILVNWAYSREHDAAAEMPRFSPRRPVEFVRLLRLADGGLLAANRREASTRDSPPERSALDGTRDGVATMTPVFSLLYRAGGCGDSAETR